MLNIHGYGACSHQECLKCAGPARKERGTACATEKLPRKTVQINDTKEDPRQPPGIHVSTDSWESEDLGGRHARQPSRRHPLVTPRPSLLVFLQETDMRNKAHQGCTAWQHRFVHVVTVGGGGIWAHALI